MPWIVAVRNVREQLDYSQMAVCKHCGKESHLEVFADYKALKLFGLRTLCWNKHYEAVMCCCGAHCPLETKMGERIEKGRNITISQDDLQPVDKV